MPRNISDRAFGRRGRFTNVNQVSEGNSVRLPKHIWHKAFLFFFFWFYRETECLPITVTFLLLADFSPARRFLWSAEEKFVTVT